MPSKQQMRVAYPCEGLGSTTDSCCLGWGHPRLCMPANAVVAAIGPTPNPTMAKKYGLVVEGLVDKMQRDNPSVDFSVVQASVDAYNNAVVAAPPSGLSQATDARPYEILGLAVGAPVADVKKAFRALAKLHHPDKGGDAEAFVEVHHAYFRINTPSDKADELVAHANGVQANLGMPVPHLDLCEHDEVWVSLYMQLLSILGEDAPFWGVGTTWQHPHGSKWLVKLTGEVKKLKFDADRGPGRNIGDPFTEKEMRTIQTDAFVPGGDVTILLQFTGFQELKKAKVSTPGYLALEALYGPWGDNTPKMLKYYMDGYLKETKATRERPMRGQKRPRFHDEEEKNEYVEKALYESTVYLPMDTFGKKMTMDEFHKAVAKKLKYECAAGPSGC